MIQARQPNGNGPTAIHIGTAESAATPGTTGLVTVRAAADNDDYSAALVFSTEASSRSAATVSVKSAADYVAAMTRGASNRATVTVADQYGDPIAGAQVTLTTTLTHEGETDVIVIGGGRALAVGRDGTYTFGYTRRGATAATETLTASWTYTQDLNNDGTADDPGTHSGEDTVEWAIAGAAAESAGAQIVAFDTDTNTIFVGTAGSTVVVNYDSNDRFDIDRADAGAVSSNYAAFEKELSTATGYTLEYLAIRFGGPCVPGRDQLRRLLRDHPGHRRRLLLLP